uniref:Uncharacterized protein n=1 Tax=Ditylenchus dipsaci TaxID=166011 RepID=A0A915CYJ0_9BILA
MIEAEETQFVCLQQNYGHSPDKNNPVTVVNPEEQVPDILVETPIAVPPKRCYVKRKWIQAPDSSENPVRREGLRQTINRPQKYNYIRSSCVEEDPANRDYDDDLTVDSQNTLPSVKET